MVVTLFSSYYEKFTDGTVVCIDDEIPFDVPKGWEWCRIEQYTQQVTDFVASGSFASLRANVKYYNHPEYAILVRTKDFQTNFKSDLVYTDKHGYDFLSNSNLYGGEIILPNIGASIGKIFIVPNLKQKMTLAPNSVMVRFYNNEHKDWFYNVFLSPFGVSTLFEISSSTAQGKFNKTDFKKILIPLPPLAEQQRIVAKLQELMPVVEQYDSAQSKLDSLNTNINELLKKSILQEAIQGKLVPQDPNDEPASALLQRIREEKAQLLKEGKLKKKDIVDSVIFKGEDNKYYEQIGDEVIDITEDIPFEIPDSWEWIRFGNLVKMNIGKTPPRGDSQYWSNGVYHWVSISDMNDYGLIGSTKERISLLASEKIMGEISAVGTLLMSFKLTVGRTSILNIEAFHNEAIISIYPYVDKDFAIRDYLFYSLPLIANSGESKDAIKGKTLNSKSLFNILVPLPPRDEQKRIVYKIRELYALL